MANADRVLVDFGDGVDRELDYSVEQVQTHVDANGGEDTAIMNLHFATKLLPIVYDGLVDKTDLPYEAFRKIVRPRQKEKIVAAFFMAFWGTDYAELKAMSKAAFESRKNAQGSQLVN
jgi:hypothetical protein